MRRRAAEGLAMASSDRLVLCVGACFSSPADARAAASGLLRDGLNVVTVLSQDAAARLLCERAPTVVLIDLGLADGSPLAVADFCSYRRPEARVILAGCGGLMADGAIFGHVTNAAALVPGRMPPADMAALIAFHADRGRPAPARAALRARTLADLSGTKLPIGRHADQMLAG